MSLEQDLSHFIVIHITKVGSHPQVPCSVLVHVKAIIEQHAADDLLVWDALFSAKT